MAISIICVKFLLSLIYKSLSNISLSFSFQTLECGLLQIILTYGPRLITLPVLIQGVVVVRLVTKGPLTLMLRILQILINNHFFINQAEKS